MTKEELIFKIAQETYYVRRMFKTRKTLEQVECVNHLACFLIGEKWRFFEHQLALHTSIDVAHTINDAATDLELFYRQAKNRVEEKRNNGVIKTGYWD